MILQWFWDDGGIVGGLVWTLFCRRKCATSGSKPQPEAPVCHAQKANEVSRQRTIITAPEDNHYNEEAPGRTAYNTTKATGTAVAV